MNRQLSALAILVFVMAIVLSACGTLSEDVLTIKTADQGLTLHFRLQQPAPPLPTITPAVVPPTPTEESLLPTVTPTPCVIKGNIASDGTHIAHSPGQANYDNVIIDETKGERCFATLDEAIAAGWRPAQR